MYKKILVPVDLEHTEVLARALGIATQLAGLNDAELVFAGVHGGPPSEIAHNPGEFREKLEAFVRKQPFAETGKMSALPVYSLDPGVEVASSIIKAARDHDVDLVVMASHIPGWSEHIFHSNAGYVACHAPMSVFVVR